MTLGSLKVRIGADISEAQAAFRTLEAQTKGLADNIKAVGETLSRRVTAPLVAFGTGAVLAAGSFDRLSKGLAAVSGSSEEAARQIERLRVIAQAPGLGFEEAVGASTNLQAVGISAGEAERAISELGNALALTGGTKDDFAEVVRQFTQIQSLGKVTAENLNVIRERAPAVSGALQDAFAGVDLSKVPVADFTAALLHELEKLERAAPSLLEPFVNGFDSLKQSVVPVGETIARVVTPAFVTFAGAVKSLSESFARLDGPTQEMIVQFGLIAAAIGPLLIVTAAIVAALPALGAAFTVIAGPIGAAAFVLGLLTKAYIDNRAAAIMVDKGLSQTEARAQALSGTLADVVRWLDRFSSAAGGVSGFLTRAEVAANSFGLALRHQIAKGLADLLAPIAVFVPALGSVVTAFREVQAQAVLDFSGVNAVLETTRALAAATATTIERVFATASRLNGNVIQIPGATSQLSDGPLSAPPVLDISPATTKKTTDAVRTVSDVVKDLNAQLALTQAQFSGGLASGIEAARSRASALAAAFEAAFEAAGNRLTPAVTALRDRAREAALAVEGFARVGREGPSSLDALANVGDLEPLRQARAQVEALAGALRDVPATGIDFDAMGEKAFAAFTKARKAAGFLAEAVADVVDGLAGASGALVVDAFGSLFGGRSADEVEAFRDGVRRAQADLREAFATGQIGAAELRVGLADLDAQMADFEVGGLEAAFRSFGAAIVDVFKDVVQAIAAAIAKLLIFKAIQLGLTAAGLGGFAAPLGAVLGITSNARTGPPPPSVPSAGVSGRSRAAYADPAGNVVIPAAALAASGDRFQRARLADGVGY